MAPAGAGHAGGPHRRHPLAFLLPALLRVTGPTTVLPSPPHPPPDTRTAQITPSADVHHPAMENRRWAIQSGMSIADTSIAAASAALSSTQQRCCLRRMEGLPRGEQGGLERERDGGLRGADRTGPLAQGTDAPTQNQAGDWDQDHVYVGFDAPATIGEITVQLTIRDDFDRSDLPQLAGGPTHEQVAEVIWGPYRFNPRVHDTEDGLGRTVSAFSLLPGDHQQLALRSVPETFLVRRRRWATALARHVPRRIHSALGTVHR